MRQHVYVIGAVEIGVVDGRPIIRGECDLANATEIESWLRGFGRAAIDVDLSGVTFFDAAALRALLKARRRNPNMRIVEPSPAVRRVLELTGTYAVFVDGRQP
jgi:anti-anti-sigma factor